MSEIHADNGIAGLATATDCFTQAFYRGIQPDQIHLKVSEWADKYRMLSTRASSEPGRWNTSRTPYLREPMDSLSPQDVTKEVVLLFGSQLGKTETGLNWIGCVIDIAPGPMLMVQPNGDMVKKVVRQRLDPAIADTPQLREKVSEQKGREGGNSQWAKEFEGGILIMATANASAGLASMPMRYLFLDEVDRYPDDVDGEGDPINLAKARTRTFSGNSKTLETSTPTEEGKSRISASFEETDKRHYYVPCPQCNFEQLLTFGNLKWDKETDEHGKVTDLPETVYYVCESCGHPIQEHKKTWMLENGKWVPHAPEVKYRRGYFLNSLYSPLGWYSWQSIVEDFLKAKDKPTELKVFVNTVLAQTWAEKGEVPDWEAMYKRRREYKFNTCPKGVLFLTAGVDVQRDRIEMEVVGWGRDYRSWSIDYRVFKGAPAEGEVWKDLWAALQEKWPVEGSTESLILSMMAVDSSDQTQIVYKQVRDVSSARVMAVKGMDNQIVPVSQPRAADIDINGQKIFRGVQFWPVGVSLLKTELYGFFRLPAPMDNEAPPVGFCEWPQYEKEYFLQLTAEQRMRRTIGGRTAFRWEKRYERNEALDCRVYARAAAYVYGLDRFTPLFWAVALSDRLPKNSESRALGIALRLIKKNYPHMEWVVSFADATQCGDGTIYRAAGFVLTGIRKNNNIIRLQDGTVASAMTYTKGRHVFKTAGAAVLPAGAERLKGFQLRYIYFLNPAARARLTVPALPFSAIAENGAKMYKGRAEEALCIDDAFGFHPEEGGVSPTPPLHNTESPNPAARKDKPCPR